MLSSVWIAVSGVGGGGDENGQEVRDVHCGDSLSVGDAGRRFSMLVCHDYAWECRICIAGDATGSRVHVRAAGRGILRYAGHATRACGLHRGCCRCSNCHRVSEPSGPTGRGRSQRVLAFITVIPTTVLPSLRTRMSSPASIVFVACCGLRRLMYRTSASRS